MRVRGRGAGRPGQVRPPGPGWGEGWCRGRSGVGRRIDGAVTAGATRTTGAALAAGAPLAGLGVDLLGHPLGGTGETLVGLLLGEVALGNTLAEMRLDVVDDGGDERVDVDALLLGDLGQGESLLTEVTQLLVGYAERPGDGLAVAAEPAAPTVALAGDGGGLVVDPLGGVGEAFVGLLLGEVALGHALGEVRLDIGEDRSGDRVNADTELGGDVGALVMYEILKNGGFTTGGLNFDTKLRRQSCERDDLFLGHIGGMDTMAKALLNAAELMKSGELSDFVTNRYAGWQQGLGKSIINGEHSLESLAKVVHENNINPTPVSGRQELLENIVNRYV